jgi:multidrug efflux pump subunit AcrA (membrane-fusion protein)
MVVEGRILSNVYEDVIYTSVNNIKEEYDRLYVFVVDEENRAKKVRVDLGIQVERDVIIADGVDPGQRIVIEGIDNLQDGSLVEVRN